MLFEAFARSFPAILAALTLSAVLTYAFSIVQQRRRLAKLGGQPPFIPSKTFGIVEALKTFSYGRRNRNAELWQERFQLQGHTVGLKIVHQPAILTDDPENIKAILAAQFQEYGKGEQFHIQWKDFLGDSIFTTDGKQWSDSRHLIRPQFIKDRVSDLHTFEYHVQKMISLIPCDGGTVDISDLFYRFTLDSATDFLLGNSVDSLSHPAVEFAQAFAEIQQHMNNSARLGPLSKLMPRSRFKKNLKVLNEYVEPFVERTLLLGPEELKSKHAEGYTFLHALAEFTKDHTMLRDQLVAILLAARDTTAATLSWTLYELASHPEVVSKLRKEILEKVGPTAAPTYVDLKEMKYLQAVMNETLRLYPAVPFNVRTALKDTYLPHGGGESGFEPIGVAEGTLVGYSTYTMQRRKDLFGPDVEEFKPERWATWTPKAWQYIPFNGGPRICLGQQFALTEMAYVLVRLFQAFDGVEDRQTEPQFERCEITISPGAGVPVAMRPVKEQ